MKWKRNRLLGASLKVIASPGHYYLQSVVNWGINRWSFKPELGTHDDLKATG
jgi:hypothetical protein